MRTLLLVLIIYCGTVSRANAVCTIIGISSASLSTAIPTGPLSTTAQNAVASTLSVSFTLAIGIGSGCSIAFKISGALTSGGGGSIPYSISSSSGGSPTISYTTTVNGTAPVTPTTVSVPTYLILPPGVYTPGIYTDSAARVEAYNSLVPISLAVRAVTPTLQIVQTTCTIGGTSNGGVKTLDFSNGRTISTAQQFANFGSVTCNSPATISLSSSNGAATNGAAAITGFQNAFDYVATTTLSGSTVTLDTSTLAGAGAGAGASESAAGSITASSTVNAPLSIGITPRVPVKPLMSGTYTDVLTVMIAPD